MTSHNGVQFKGHGTTDCMKLNMLFIVKPGKKNKKKTRNWKKPQQEKKLSDNWVCSCSGILWQLMGKSLS